MDVKTFFSLFFILLAIGTIASAITGVPMPGGSAAVVHAANNTMGVANQSVATTCESWIPGACAVSDVFSPLVVAISSFLGWIWGGLQFGVAVFAYFTGIGAFTSGTIALPPPLDLIFLLGITFLWLFIILELIRRVIGVVWGR